MVKKRFIFAQFKTNVKYFSSTVRQCLLLPSTVLTFALHLSAEKFNAIEVDISGHLLANL